MAEMIVVAVTALRPWQAEDGRTGTMLYMWCPGCEDLHGVEVTEPARRWQWDGNRDAPTISPSIKVSGVQWDVESPFHKPRHQTVAAGSPVVCHSHVKAGRWEFLGDCSHALAGQTVPMVPLPEWIANL